MSVDLQQIRNNTFVAAIHRVVLDWSRPGGQFPVRRRIVWSDDRGRGFRGWVDRSNCWAWKWSMHMSCSLDYCSKSIDNFLLMTSFLCGIHQTLNNMLLYFLWNLRSLKWIKAAFGLWVVSVSHLLLDVLEIFCFYWKFIINNNYYY